MKNFIASKWIPISLFCIMILSLALLKVINSFTSETVSLLFLIMYLPIMLIYIPALAITVIRTNHPQKQNIINNIGLFCLAAILTSLIFKTFHLPGAPIHFPVGAFIFLTTFFPAWFILKIKGADWQYKLFYFLMVNFYASMVLWGLFSTMHYPGLDTLLTVTIFSAIIFVAFLIFMFVKRKIKFNFKEQFIFIFYLAYVFGSRQMAYIRDLRYNSVSINQEQADKNLDLNKRKAQFIYDAFNTINSKDSLFLLNYKNVKTIKILSDSIEKHIDLIKALLVSNTQEISLSQADTLQYKNIRVEVKSNYDIPTLFLFSDSLLNTKNIYNVYELRKKLLQYSDTLLFFSPEDYKTQFKQYNPIQIVDSKEYEDGREITWEISNFEYRTLGSIYTTLTNIQSDVKSAEIVVLNELFNRANQNRKENLAAQLSELALKYETEKKEKQISLLEKDKELNSTKLLAKDAEISKTRNTLIYFVFIVVLFIVLIVFVVRANLQRKKANQLLSEQKSKIEEQKHLVEEKQKEILDSITYAKRLQQAILPPTELITKNFPNSFVLYQPKDIVAGDFYWAEKINDLFFIAAADCTGHGVPGAMVSVVCSSALNRTVKEFALSDTAKILDKTRELVIETFEKSNAEVKDGMDISLLCIDKQNQKIHWSGANNPLWYIQDKSLIEVKADKQPVGKSYDTKAFTSNRIEYKPNTTFYLFTDGFADQFGGPNGKKFKYKQFQELLLGQVDEAMPVQQANISSALENWKGELEQVDDICVIGIRI